MEKTAEKNVFQQLFTRSEKGNGTWYDEAKMYLGWVIAFTAVTRIITYTFANRIFLSWLGEPANTYAAVLVSALLEAAIVFVGITFAKGLANRSTFYRPIEFGIWFFTGLAFSVALAWGYKISTHGQTQIAVLISNKTAIAKDSTTLSDLAAVDKSLEKVENDKQTGLAQKWKKVVTWEGTQIARNAQKSEAELLRQRGLLLERSFHSDSLATAKKDYETGVKSEWTGIFGGNMELISLFSLLAFGFCSVAMDGHKMAKTPVITGNYGNYEIKDGLVWINGTSYDRTKLRQWLTNTEKRETEAKTDKQREHFTELAGTIRAAMSEYDQLYNTKLAA